MSFDGIRVTGPAARQFIDPVLTPTFDGYVPRVGEAWSSQRGPRNVSGIVMTPSGPMFLTEEKASPHVLLLDGPDTYNFRSRTAEAAIFPLLRFPILRAEGHSVVELVETTERATDYQLPDSVSISTFMPTSSWSKDADGNIYGGFCLPYIVSHVGGYDFNYSFYVKRNYVLVAYNGEMGGWYIPTASYRGRKNFVDLMGIGPPLGAGLLEYNLGYVPKFHLLKRFENSQRIHRSYSDGIQAEFMAEVRGSNNVLMADGGIGIRLGLPSTFRANMSFKEAVSERPSEDCLRIPAEEMVCGILESDAFLARHDLFQVDHHLQNFVERWVFPKGLEVGEAEVRLNSVDWYNLIGPRQVAGWPMELMPFHAYNFLGKALNPGRGGEVARQGVARFLDRNPEIAGKPQKNKDELIRFIKESLSVETTLISHYYMMLLEFLYPERFADGS